MGAAASTGSKAQKAADQIFTKADKDKNGKLSVDELIAAAQKYGEDVKKAWPRERIETTVKKYDRDKDGQLNKKEWQQSLVELSKDPPKPGTKEAAANAGAAVETPSGPSESDQRRRALKASKAALEAAKANAKSIFVSADTDRDEELSVREFILFLKKQNEEYEFMEAEGAVHIEYCKLKYTEWGGELKKPRKPSSDDDEEDEDEDEPHGVLLAEFTKWWPPFHQACEDKKRDEYEATKDLSEEECTEWKEERPLGVRANAYEALAGPQLKIGDWKEHAAKAQAGRKAAEIESETQALFAQRKREGQSGEAVGEAPDGSKLG